MRRSRKKSRHIQLHLNLNLELMAEVARREEESESYALLPNTLIFKQRIAKLDPFFLEITEQNIL